MSHIEMDFYNFIRQLDCFFKSQTIEDSIKESEEDSAKITAKQLIEVMKAVDRLKKELDYNKPKVQNGIVADEQIRIEAQLNPFTFLKVKIATHFISSTEIHGEKMNIDEARERLKM